MEALQEFSKPHFNCIELVSEALKQGLFGKIKICSLCKRAYGQKDQQLLSVPVFMVCFILILMCIVMAISLDANNLNQ